MNDESEHALLCEHVPGMRAIVHVMTNDRCPIKQTAAYTSPRLHHRAYWMDATLECVNRIDWIERTVAIMLSCMLECKFTTHWPQIVTYMPFDCPSCIDSGHGGYVKPILIKHQASTINDA